jgi:hypothetical protein
MSSQIDSWATWTLLRMQFVTANLDAEVLQWPGGSLIATFLCIVAMIKLTFANYHPQLGNDLRGVAIAA